MVLHPLTIAIQAAPLPVPVAGVHPVSVDFRNREAALKALPAKLQVSPLAGKALVAKRKDPRPEPSKLLNFKEVDAMPFHGGLVHH